MGSQNENLNDSTSDVQETGLLGKGLLSHSKVGLRSIDRDPIAEPLPQITTWPVLKFYKRGNVAAAIE